MRADTRELLEYAEKKGIVDLFSRKDVPEDSKRMLVEYLVNNLLVKHTPARRAQYHEFLADIFANFPEYRKVASSIFTKEHIEALIQDGRKWALDVIKEILKHEEFSRLHKATLEILVDGIKRVDPSLELLPELLENEEFARHRRTIASTMDEEHIKALLKRGNTYTIIFPEYQELLKAILKRKEKEFANLQETAIKELLEIIHEPAARRLLENVIKCPEFSHLREKIIEAFPSAPASRYVIALAHELAKHYPDKREKIEEIVHRIMGEIYKEIWKKDPPEPRNPEKLPQKTRTYVVEHTIPAEEGTVTTLPGDVVKAAKELGISLRSIYEVHNAIDVLTVHRDQILKQMEQKGVKREEAEKKITRLLEKLKFLAEEIGTRRIILDFYLRPTPKKALEWVDARIRASSDCTVPSFPSPYSAFEGHTVPYFFSSNAFNLEIRATHLDTVKIKKKGKVKIRTRVRKDRHVGNVYAALLKREGKNVLYISGIQLGKIYRGRENTAIAKPILRAIHEIAEHLGADEVWFNAEDLSNFVALMNRIVEHIKALGAKRLLPSEDLDYGDLPRSHYASPSLTAVYAIPTEKLKKI